jgi:hypothetical protein
MKTVLPQNLLAMVETEECVSLEPLFKAKMEPSRHLLNGEI